MEENNTSPVDDGNEDLPPYLREEPPEGQSCFLPLHVQSTNKRIHFSV